MLLMLLLMNRNGVKIAKNYTEHQLLFPLAKIGEALLELERQKETKNTTIANIKITYTRVNDHLILLAASKEESNFHLQKRVNELKEKFLELKNKCTNPKEFYAAFRATIDDVIVTPVKISLVGYGGVGKTTILKLIRGETPPKEYKPTLTPEVATLESAMEGTVETASVGNVRVVVWDFAGQEQFRALWNLWIRGSDIVILVTDSTRKNVEESKILLDLIREWAPHIKVIAFANKQDLPEAMKPEEVSEILGIKAHGTIAIDPTYRPIILDILKKTIESILREGIKYA